MKRVMALGAAVLALGAGAAAFGQKATAGGAAAAQADGGLAVSSGTIDAHGQGRRVRPGEGLQPVRDGTDRHRCAAPVDPGGQRQGLPEPSRRRSPA